MKELVEFIVKSLVDHPQDVSITEKSEGENIYLELRVNPEDMGKVIGKQGRIAKSIRTLIKASSSKDDKKTVLEIVQ